MEDRNLLSVIAEGLRQLEKGVKKLEVGASYEDAFGDKKVDVSIYWAGTVARIDIKGLK